MHMSMYTYVTYAVLVHEFRIVIGWDQKILGSPVGGGVSN